MKWIRVSVSQLCDEFHCLRLLRYGLGLMLYHEAVKSSRDEDADLILLKCRYAAWIVLSSVPSSGVLLGREALLSNPFLLPAGEVGAFVKSVHGPVLLHHASRLLLSLVLL